MSADTNQPTRSAPCTALRPKPPSGELRLPVRCTQTGVLAR